MSKLISNNGGEMIKPKITPDLLKMSKTLTCSCGGMLFKQSMVFKKISAILSPSGKEELLPIDVIVCEKCNKVNREMLQYDILPEELMEQPLINLNINSTYTGSTGSFNK